MGTRFWTDLHGERTSDNDHRLKQGTSDLRQNISIYRTFKHWKRLPRNYPERMCSLLPWSFRRLNKTLGNLVWFHRWSCFEKTAELELDVSSNLIILLYDSSLDCCKRTVTKTKQKTKPATTPNPSALQLCNLTHESSMGKSPQQNMWHLKYVNKNYGFQSFHRKALIFSIVF